MVIVIVGHRRDGACASSLVRHLVPSATCLLTSDIRDLGGKDSPVPPISGILVEGHLEELPEDMRELIEEMGQRFPLACTAECGSLEPWAASCQESPPQLPRQPERHPWQTHVRVEASAFPAARMNSTANISRGGVYVEDPDTKPAVGEPLKITFTSFDRPLVTRAVVRWVCAEDQPSHRAGYGCQFVDIASWVSGLLIDAAQREGEPMGRVSEG